MMGFMLTSKTRRTETTGSRPGVLLSQMALVEVEAKLEEGNEVDRVLFVRTLLRILAINMASKNAISSSTSRLGSELDTALQGENACN